jgi:hypothetical protein
LLLSLETESEEPFRGIQQTCGVAPGTCFLSLPFGPAA